MAHPLLSRIMQRPPLQNCWSPLDITAETLSPGAAPRCLRNDEDGAGVAQMARVEGDTHGS
jgi:hypothetical protein